MQLLLCPTGCLLTPGSQRVITRRECVQVGGCTILTLCLLLFDCCDQMLRAVPSSMETDSSSAPTAAAVAAGAASQSPSGSMRASDLPARDHVGRARYTELPRVVKVQPVPVLSGLGCPSRLAIGK